MISQWLRWAKQFYEIRVLRLQKKFIIKTDVNQVQIGFRLLN